VKSTYHHDLAITFHIMGRPIILHLNILTKPVSHMNCI